MATAGEDTAEEEILLECGLCFENDELKRLPCNPDHIYCTLCLTKDSEHTKIIKCPQCRFVEWGTILSAQLCMVCVLHRANREKNCRVPCYRSPLLSIWGFAYPKKSTCGCGERAL